MSTAQLHREEDSAVGRAIRLLFVCDFPPSNFAGGPILISRLLKDYPVDRLTVLTSSRYLDVSPKEGRLGCAHIAFPTTKGWGRWGLGRIKNAIDWLAIPVLALATVYLIRRRRVEVILALAHGPFFVGAALAGRITGTPYVVVMHDDTVTPIERQSSILKYILRPLFRWALRGAAHIYAVSDEMQEFLKARYGVDSDLQRPGTEGHRNGTAVAGMFSSDVLVILYAGAITDVVEDSLRLLAETVVTGKLKIRGREGVELHLYTQLSQDKIRDWGWNHHNIQVRGWVPQEELPRVLQGADILFLPFSFSEGARHAVENAFPSKTADYLAAGKPILVFGPPYSSLVRYAADEGFAEIVDEFDQASLIRGIENILSSKEYQSSLVERSREVFSRSHDIVQQRVQLRWVLGKVSTDSARKRASSGVQSL